ncbi:MAG: hypothetical protein LBQ47_02465 [Endomicrobium sp.]|jgi:hypothetical protein|nr:hypothetical protein [Endomicrobium sp.]
MKNFGKTIIPYDVSPEPHELETAKFFNKLGKDVTFIAPIYEKGAKTPDIKMDGLFWEIKAPKNKGKHTIEHAFRKALKQSKNIIFDLRRTKMPNDKCVSQITKQFALIRNVNRLLIITKDKRLIDLNG